MPIDISLVILLIDILLAYLNIFKNIDVFLCFSKDIVSVNAKLTEENYEVFNKAVCGFVNMNLFISIINKKLFNIIFNICKNVKRDNEYYKKFICPLAFQQIDEVKIKEKISSLIDEFYDSNLFNIITYLNEFSENLKTIFDKLKGFYEKDNVEPSRKRRKTINDKNFEELYALIYSSFIYSKEEFENTVVKKCIPILERLKEYILTLSKSS